MFVCCLTWWQALFPLLLLHSSSVPLPPPAARFGVETGTAGETPAHVWGTLPLACLQAWKNSPAVPMGGGGTSYLYLSFLMFEAERRSGGGADRQGQAGLVGGRMGGKTSSWHGMEAKLLAVCVAALFSTSVTLTAHCLLPNLSKTFYLLWRAGKRAQTQAAWLPPSMEPWHSLAGGSDLVTSASPSTSPQHLSMPGEKRSPSALPSSISHLCTSPMSLKTN